MAKPRVMTTKRLRSLIPSQAYELLRDYSDTDVGYRALVRKYHVSQNMIGPIIRGLTYRELDDEFPGFAEARKRAQAKAAGRSELHTRALAVRVPDATKSLIEVDLSSLPSVVTTISKLEAVKSLLLMAGARKIA